jgi:hypothetical protein
LGEKFHQLFERVKIRGPSGYHVFDPTIKPTLLHICLRPELEDERPIRRQWRPSLGVLHFLFIHITTLFS